MNPRRETGNSAMLMVLMLLLFGTMMLVGLSSHLTAQRQWGVQEIKSIVRYAGAQSALAWGEGLRWQRQPRWQCQTETVSARHACLYQTSGSEVLLAGFLADDSPAVRVTLWRWGGLKKGKFIASAHGWLDYCPLGDKTDCDLAL